MVYHQQEPSNNINQKHHLPVYKPPTKQSKKPPTSGPGSTQPRVYNVKPIHFRELVQRLTGAGTQTTAQPQRLQSAAPPPIQLNSWAYSQKNDQSSSSVEATAAAPQVQKKSAGGDGFLIGDLGMELSLSPTSCSWFSFPLLSPGPLSNYGA